MNSTASNNNKINKSTEEFISEIIDASKVIKDEEIERIKIIFDNLNVNPDTHFLVLYNSFKEYFPRYEFKRKNGYYGKYLFYFSDEYLTSNLLNSENDAIVIKKNNFSKCI